MIEQWTSCLRPTLPEAEVIGVLSDGPGVLVRVDMPATAENTRRIELTLAKLGATGWSWEHNETYKIRVYQRRTYYWWLVLLPLGYLCYDIHIISLAGSWISQSWG